MERDLKKIPPSCRNALLIEQEWPLTLLFHIQNVGFHNLAITIKRSENKRKFAHNGPRSPNYFYTSGCYKCMYVVKLNIIFNKSLCLKILCYKTIKKTKNTCSLEFETAILFKPEQLVCK